MNEPIYSGLKGVAFCNPTGKGVRTDEAGSGFFGSPRGTRYHNGFDFKCEPGQAVLMPVDGSVVRVSHPYANDLSWTGALIVGDRVSIKLWYFEPAKTLFGIRLTAGWIIGRAQDITKRYPGQGMTPHLHMKIEAIDPSLLFDFTLGGGEVVHEMGAE